MKSITKCRNVIGNELKNKAYQNNFSISKIMRKSKNIISGSYLTYNWYLIDRTYRSQIITKYKPIRFYVVKYKQDYVISRKNGKI